MVFYILVMMAGMFAGAVLYFAQPTLTGIAEALGLNMVVMGVGAIAVLHNWTGHEGDVEEDEKVATTENFGKPSDELELKRAIVISRAYVIYFLVMMASMSAVGFVYIFDTAVIGLDEGLILGNAMMVPGIVAILWYASKHPNDINELPAQTTRSIKLERWTLVFLVLLNEFLMGWAFVLASGSRVITSGSFMSIASSTFNNVTGSDWFLFTLSSEVVFSLYLLRKFFPREFVKIGCLQSLILIFVPTAIDGRIWTATCVFAELAILAGFILLYQQRQNKKQSGILKYLRAVLIFDSLVVAGSLIWIVGGSVFILYACVVGEAIIYFSAILERIGIGKEKPTSPRVSGQTAASGAQARP